MIHNNRTLSRALLSRASYGVLALAAAAAISSTAYAQEAGDEDAVSEVVVRGYRASLQSALAVKRDATVMVDAINAEDIADFPDANLAESLQRLPGVSIDRDNGEGRTISIRGLGGDFTRTRLNGLETTSTTGSNGAGDSPNRSRGFDFNTFASELFSSLRVQKTASAETDEGSLGATVDLITGRPFNFRGRRIGLSIQDDFYTNGKYHNPRIAGLISDTWFDNRLGVLASVAYSERQSQVDGYLRSPGTADYAYRNMTFGIPFQPLNPGNSPATPARTGIQIRQGFATPEGTSCNGGTIASPINTGLVPGVNITNLTACNALRGSNAAAYALIMGDGLATANTGTNFSSGNLGNVTTTEPSSTVIIPALPSLQQNQLRQQRLGGTLSFQVRPTDRTLVSIDGVYSRFYSNSQNFQISTIGLNRSNIGGTQGNAYYTAPLLADQVNFIPNAAERTAGRAAYSTCSPTTGNTSAAPLDCGAELYGTTLVPGYWFSVNPNNLDIYDYYNNKQSPGYIADPRGQGGRELLIGRPSTVIHAAGVSDDGKVANYLELGNVDLRSADDQSINRTLFNQVSIAVEHRFTDRFRMNAIYGQSESDFKGTGILVDLIALDTAQTIAGTDDLVNPAGGYYLYDETDGGDMPVINFTADAADPTKFSFVKGYSVLRHFKRSVDNNYENARLDFAYDVGESQVLKFGLSRRVYNFSTSQLQRASGVETFNPTLLEAGATTADISRLITFGNGLEVPEGTTTQFIVPDNDKVIQLLDFTCNCVNKYGDFRLFARGSLANQYDVEETDTGAYIQLDFKGDFFGRTLRGNAGFRYANTKVVSESFGSTGAVNGVMFTGGADYDDFLPSLNLSYELADNLLLRVGLSKVMARPMLDNLRAGISAVSVPTTDQTQFGSLTIGNPKLAPFRADNYDVSLEWYFAPGGLLSVALFDKEISNNPQNLLSESPLAARLDPDQIALIRSTQTNPLALQYIDNGGVFVFRQYQNTPGGYIRGIELSYQQDLTFLPSFLSGFGIQANFTHLDSEFQYILDPGTKNAQGVFTVQPTYYTGPYLAASPNAFNFTIYYTHPKWEGRVSASQRAEYITTLPVTGQCSPGFCDSPNFAEFGGSRETLNVDASFSYKVSDNIRAVIEAQNLTNQTNNRFGILDNEVVSRYESTGRTFRAGITLQY